MAEVTEENVEITKENIEAQRIDALKDMGMELLKHRDTILYGLDNDDISESIQEISLEATDELLSVIILGIGGKDFDVLVTNEEE